MRRLLPLLLLLCLTACAAEPAAFVPADTAQSLLDSGAFSQALDTLEKDTACEALYGLDPETVTDCVVYASLTAGAEELAVLTLAGPEAAETALAALEDRVADQKEALKNYQPDEVAKLDRAILQQRGNSVVLVVAADAELAQSALDALS